MVRTSRRYAGSSRKQSWRRPHSRNWLRETSKDECLTINSFYSLLHAQVIISDWKNEYNHHHRHSPLGYLIPAKYAQQCTHQTETDDPQNVRTESRERLTDFGLNRTQGLPRYHSAAALA